MKNTEIRIGNLIASGKEFNDKTSLIGKVISIGMEESEFEQVYCECEESYSWFFKDNYCGIPLTPEWLVRLGLEKFDDCDNDWRIGLGTGDGVDLSIELIDEECCLVRRHTCDGEFTTGFDYCYIKWTKHVHTLQNAYFALTNTELKLKD